MAHEGQQVVQPAQPIAREHLLALVSDEVSRSVNPDVDALAAALMENPGALGVVFYGSGLWLEAGADTMYDFYVIIGRFPDWAPSRMLAVGGNLVPPNVYYLDLQREGRTVRCKYAVIRLSQFEKAARGESFTPHIWARFCQPCRLLRFRDQKTEARMMLAVADAIVTFHERTLPLVDQPSVQEFWVAGLRSTYAAELRPENADRARRLFESNEGAYTERTRLALPLCNAVGQLTDEGRVESRLGSRQKQRLRLMTRLRRPFQKLIPLCRITKASFTFRGGIDYAKWKIERHSGVSIHVSEWQRRHPFVGGLFLMLKVAWRRGVR